MHKFELKIRTFLSSSTGQMISVILQCIPYLFIIVALKTVLIFMVLNSFPIDTNERQMKSNDYGLINDFVDSDKGIEVLTEKEDQNWKVLLKEKGVNGFLETVLTPSHTNRTHKNTTWLFFNRMPRTGGQTIVSLLQALGKDGHFAHQEHKYRTPWQRILTEDEQKNLVTWFESNFWPISYDRFSLFVNFTKYRSPFSNLEPAFISMVRDPVEKFISNFHHKRTDPEISKIEMSAREKQNPGSGRKWYLRTIDECVLEKDKECNFQPNDPDYLSSIPFICGQNEGCLLFDSKWALQTAKFNAEYEYSVIGIVENMNSTLQVLEKYIPKFFDGAVDKYWSPEYKKRWEKKNPKKFKRPSEKVIKILKDKFALEMEMYEFLRQRLARQYSLTLYHFKYRKKKIINKEESKRKALAQFKQELENVKKKFEMSRTKH